MSENDNTKSSDNQPQKNPAPMPAPRRRRWVTVLAAILLFTSGLVIGSSGTIVVAVRGFKYAAQHPEEAPRRIARRLEHKLSLTADQMRKVEAILQQRQSHLIALRRDVQPKVVAELDDSYQEISLVLNQEQRERWQSMYDDLKRDWIPPVAPASTAP